MSSSTDMNPVLEQLKAERKASVMEGLAQKTTFVFHLQVSNGSS